MRKCPLCGAVAEKALLGPFKVNLCFCQSKESPVLFGLLAPLALGIDDLVAPKQNAAGVPIGWAFFVYQGSYLKALWASMFKKEVQHG